MITIQTDRLSRSLLARFVLESELAYPSPDAQDGRLVCWLAGEGQWAVAYLDRHPAGIACLVTLDDGRYAGSRCLYWLEVLPPFRGQGVGKALLRWSEAEVSGEALLIKAVPAAAPFYRHCLESPAREIAPNTFVLGSTACGLSKGGDGASCGVRIAA